MKTNKQIEEKTIRMVADYLKSIGWNCLVGGFDSIEKGSAKYNFRLIFQFTGKKLKTKSSEKTNL